MITSAAWADFDETQTAAADPTSSATAIVSNTPSSRVDSPQYAVGEIVCKIRLLVSSGSGRINYSGTNSCDSIVQTMTGRSRIEFPLGSPVSYGNYMSCSLCQLAGSSGSMGGAHAGWTYHYWYYTAITLRAGFDWVYLPRECAGGNTYMSCNFHRAFNANP